MQNIFLTTTVLLLIAVVFLITRLYVKKQCKTSFAKQEGGGGCGCGCGCGGNG